MFDGLDRFWSTIVFRDLKYLLIGGVPLFAILFHEGVFSKEATGPSVTLSWHYWLLMIFGSYLLGIALFHFGMTIRSRERPLLRLYPRNRNRSGGGNFDELETDTLWALTELASRKQVELRYMERIIFIKEITGGLLISVLAALVVVLFYWACEKIDSCPFEWTPLDTKKTALCLSLGCLCWTAGIHNRSKAKIQADLLNRLR